MRIEYSARTDVGRRRPHNEDSITVDDSLGLFLVCDGMGGHASGEVASRVAAETITAGVSERIDEIRASLAATSVDERKVATEVMRSIVIEGNRAVRALAEEDEEHRGMGTTLSLLLVWGTRALVAHVGDSRVYLARGGQVHQVTTDHTILTEMIRAGRVKEVEAAKVRHLNALTRAVGVYPTVDVDLMELDVLPDDIFLVCSDGLHGYLDNFDLHTFLTHSEPGSAADDLVDFANKQGGHDNISAVVAYARDGQETEQTQRIRLTLDTLRNLPLFHYLTFGELLKVINVCRTMLIGPGTSVISGGDGGDDFFIIVDGVLRVHAGEHELARLEKGNHFGEMSLIDNRPRSASVTSEGAAHLIRITRADFYELLRQDSVMAVKLLWNFIQTLSSVIRMQNEEKNPVATQSRPDGFAHPYSREDDDEKQ